MPRLLSLWLVLTVVIVTLAFVLPFTLFRHVDAWHGSFLFWCVLTLVVILAAAILSARWKD